MPELLPLMEKPKFSLDFEKPIRDLEIQLEALNCMSQEQNLDVSSEIAAIKKKIHATRREIYANLTAWQKVQVARHPERPYSLDYIHAIFSGFQELHGDRRYGDDQALIGGTAFFEGEAVVILAQQKGRDTKENLRRNFGMPRPEGYRKALRLMQMAEKFSLPVISLIDTKAAYAGIESEERHVAEAIALNLREMSRLPVPIIAIILGEGGSGGALGIGVANRVLILEYAYYSVIPPEGCAAILWRDRACAPQAAEALKIGSHELLRFGVVDEIVEEPFGGSHCNTKQATENVRAALSKNLKHLRGKTPAELVEERYRKYRDMGVYEEALAALPEQAPRAQETEDILRESMITTPPATHQMQG